MSARNQSSVEKPLNKVINSLSLKKLNTDNVGGKNYKSTNNESLLNTSTKKNKIMINNYQ